MNNIDKAITQANYDSLVVQVENSSSDFIIGYYKGYVDALEYVRDETNWLKNE